MKKLLLSLVLLLALPTCAMAQCNGVFQPNTACGNNTGSPKQPTQVPIGSLAIPGGISGQVQYNNAGAFGGLTTTQLTALINAATASLSGALPAWPNNTTTFFRGDGTYATLPSSSSGGAFGGRLTLTSGVPLTTTDVTGATVVYYAPLNGQTVPIYNGATFIGSQFTSSSTDTVGLSTTLGSNWASGSAYDWFVGLNSTTVTLCSGPAWSNSGAGTSARGTGAGTTELQLVNGIWTNKNSMTCRYNNTTTFTCAVNQCTYLGSTLMTGAGATEDSAAKRYTYNQYNQSPRSIRSPAEATASWPYALTTWRQANANTANQASIFTGLTGTLADLRIDASADVGTIATNWAVPGIGVNSTSTTSATNVVPSICANRCAISAILKAYPALGLTNYTWLEAVGLASGTNTFYGAGISNGIQYQQSGLTGTVLF